MGSAAERGECGGDDGAGFEWEGPGSCEYCTAAVFYHLHFTSLLSFAIKEDFFLEVDSVRLVV